MARTDKYPDVIEVMPGAFVELDGGHRVLVVPVMNPFVVMAIAWGNCLCWCNWQGNPYPEHGVKDPPWKSGETLSIQEQGTDLVRRVTVVRVDPKWDADRKNPHHPSECKWHWEIEFTV